MSVSLNSNPAITNQYANQEAIDSSTGIKVKKSKGTFAIIKNIALAALAVQGAAMAPRAEASPATYAKCVQTCVATGTPPPLCIAGCLPFLVVPF